MKSKKALIRFTLMSGLAALTSAALHADRDDDDSWDPVSFEEGVDLLEQGWDEVSVSVEGTPVDLIDDDDYRFDTGGTEILLDLWDFEGLELPLGEAILVTGELDFTDEDDAPGLLYELDAEAIYTLDGELIAIIDDDDYRDEDDDDDYIDDEDARDDDDDDYREDDDDYRDDDDDEDYGEEELLSLEEAISRLESGWDEAYLSVEGVPVTMLDDDEYRFAIGDTEVLLDLWDDDVILAIGETILVTGELEFADEEEFPGLLYELDAMFIEDLDGNRIGDEDDNDEDRDDDEMDDNYGNRAEGTLGELIEMLEARQEDDLNVRTTGTLGERVGADFDDDDEDYTFSDESGVTVILDLDSRADVTFSLTPGMQIEVIGELERVDADDVVPEGITHELDAVWIRLADGTELDIGQLTPLSGSTVSDWMGVFWEIDDAGWYYHPSKGILYSHDALGNDDWFLSLNREDWLYASQQWYPLVYSGSDGWHYLIGSSYGDLQHAYSYSQDSWILDFWRMEQ